MTATMTVRPTRNSDGTLTAIVQPAKPPFAAMNVLRVALPPGLINGQLAGRYFLARCGAQTKHERVHDWSIYARRPLFVAEAQTPARPNHAHGTEDKGESPADVWTLALPINANDPGSQWLHELPVNASINLIGPLGSGFTLDRGGMNLVLIADRAHLPRLLPLIEPALDQRCRITLLVLNDEPDNDLRATLLDLLPLAAELQLANDLDELWQMLAEIVTWADQLCLAAPVVNQTRLAELVRAKRFRLEAGFVQVLVDADLVCGVGACLACVVPQANGGLTRACVHGPVLDLTRLAR